MELPNNEQIYKDMFDMMNKVFKENNVFQRKPTILYDDYYTNFITFLKNSFEYDRFQNEKLNIVDYVDNFKNLELFFKIISNTNVFLVEQPSFILHYLQDDNQLTTITKQVSETNIYGFVDEFNKSNKIFILYMIRSNGMLRYVTVDKDPRYIQLNVKERLKKERRLKLEQINETI